MEAMSDREPLERRIPEAPAEPPAELPRPLRLRLAATRDLLIKEAAARMVSIGRENPRLRQAGYWLYGAATRYWPHGAQVDKLGALGETLFRGAQPGPKALHALRTEMGIDTIINLRPESDHQRRAAEEMGMRYIHLPVPALDAPSHDQTLEFLRLATDPANGRVFFHCFHGVDRTGTMAACFRIAHDGWEVESAIEEMRAYKPHEKAQGAKVAYIQAFEAYWLAQSEHVRCEILHRAPPAPPAPRPWWERAWAGLKRRFTR